jgi:hypothetical protein
VNQAPISVKQARDMRWARWYGFLFLLSFFHPVLAAFLPTLGLALAALTGERRIAWAFLPFVVTWGAIGLWGGLEVFHWNSFLLSNAAMALLLLERCFSGMRRQLLWVHRAAYLATMAYLPSIVLKNVVDLDSWTMVALLVLNALGALAFLVLLPRYPGLEQLRRDLGLQSTGLARGKGLLRGAHLELRRDGCLDLSMLLPNSQLSLRSKVHPKIGRLTGGHADVQTGHLILDQLLTTHSANDGELHLLVRHPELALQAVHGLDCEVRQGQLYARFPVDNAALRADPAAYSAAVQAKVRTVLSLAHALVPTCAIRSPESVPAPEGQDTQTQQPGQAKATR